MELITVDKKELLLTVKANRGRHREIFEEALQGYRKQAVELLEQRLDQLRRGSIIAITIHLPEPADHTKDYDRVIRMLEMDLRAQVELNEHDFAAYVMDDWQWKRQFLTSNSIYSAKAVDALTVS